MPASPPQETCQEGPWVAGLRAGRLDAFRAIFDTYTPVLRRFAGVSIPSDVAEDIVQDVLFDVWQRRETLNIIEGHLTPYLFGAVRNRVWQYLRHQHIVDRRIDDPSDGSPVGMGREAAAPDTAAIADDFEAALVMAMDQLSELQRAVVTLRWTHGMSYSEVAETLAISVNAAMLHGSRARHTIRPLLERFFAEE